MKHHVFVARVAVFAFALAVCGCGSGDPPPVAEGEDASIVEIKTEVDTLISAADRAIAGTGEDLYSFGLALQENAESLRERYPQKANVVNELNMIGAQLQNGGGKPLVEMAKSKLQDLKL